MLGNENKVCKLVKSLYGLKQAPNKFDESGKGVIICLYVDDMLIFGTDQVQVDLTKEFLSSRFSIKGIGEADVILGKLSRLMYTGYPSVLEGYIDSSWISNIEDNSSTSGWVFLLSGGAISWASKKQTCITGSTMKSKFVALAVAAGKKAECVATLTKAYSQMYNGKSRHLGVRHIMIRELIMNGVIMGLEVWRVHPEVTEHPDSDSGKREFKLQMNFSELTL
ncbi:zinc finger, CCHC-type containing protein [Tanacetum coccineum]